MESEHFIADIPQKAIIPHRGKVLVVRTEKDVWELPGGRLHKGETPVEGLKREISEELGIRVEPQSVFDTFVFTSTSGANHYMVIYLCAEPENPDKIKITDGEVKELRWVDAAAAEPLPMWPEYKDVLRKYFGRSA